MSQKNFKDWLDGCREVFNKLTKVGQKYRRTETDLKFLVKCQTTSLLPNFTKLKKETIKNAKLQPNKIRKIRSEKLLIEIQTTEVKVENLKIEYEKLVLDLKKSVSSRLFNKRT